MNFAIAERNHEAATDRKFFNMQETLEKISKERAAAIKFDVQNEDSEYYFLRGDNLLEAITESNLEFQEKLAEAVRSNDAQAVLLMIKVESQDYWTKYLNGITE